MRLYNTLGRQLQDFKPIEQGIVKLYSCGPTVYNYMHIGNLRKFVFDDTLRRCLEMNGYRVKQVMNITDVGHLVSDDDEGEDKLEKGAKREGKTVWEIADYFIGAFKDDVSTMNIQAPNVPASGDGYCRATNFIPQQIEMINILLDKGYAYQTSQAIYFDTAKLASYGELTGQKLADKEVGVRRDIVTDKNKHHPQDFAVWFFTVGRFAEHDMRWESPWGDGFPGWHLECSAIIHATLGDPIDIHTGGVDNIGTHHVNEMAQTEAAYGYKPANYWVHSEHLLVQDARMAKSAGNFYTLKDVKEKGFNPLALRLLFLQAHYRSQLNFTWVALTAAQRNLVELNAWADLSKQPDKLTLMSDVETAQLNKELITALSADLNSARALAAVNKYAGQAIPSEELLRTLDTALGLGFANRKDITDQQKQLIVDRDKARDNEDWAKADELRAKLREQQLEINDTPCGPIWSRV